MSNRLRARVGLRVQKVSRIISVDDRFGSGAKAVIYTYDSGNFLNMKTNARAQTITHAVDTVGRLRSVSYSDGTPSVTLDYDRANRLRSITDASGTRSVSWT